MLISIVTPLYNSSKFIAKAIESVQKQSHQNWEMLIVDDFSTDDSASIAADFAKNDSRIRLIKLKKNAGAANARNIAIKESEGKYIAFLDSDDVWLPEKLKMQSEFMQKNNFAFTFTAYDVMNEKGKVINKINVPESINYKQYLKNTIIGCLTVMIDREKTGEFSGPLVRSRNDFAMWLQILKKGIIANGINTVTAKYRNVSNSLTSSRISAFKDLWGVYRKIEKLSVLYSIYNFSGYVINAIIKRK